MFDTTGRIEFQCATMSSIASRLKRKPLTAVLRARVPKGRRKVFEQLAALRETNMSTLVREALIEYADAHESKIAEAMQEQPATQEAQQ